jgi:Stage II sporulation protein E (SpoIIE)
VGDREDGDSMESRYGTPRELVAGLNGRETRARIQYWELLRTPLEGLMSTWAREHGHHLDRDLLTLNALHLAETHLRSVALATFDGMSWNAFRAMAVLSVARSAFRPLDGERGLDGPGPLPSSRAYHSETYFRPYQRLADAWFGGDWYVGREGADGSLWVFLADVTGHGYHAHLLACGLPDVWRRCWDEVRKPDPEPAHVLTLMHDLLSDCLPDGIFLECTLVRLGADGRVTVAPAGGTRLLIRRGGMQTDLYYLRGAWLGLRPPELADQRSWMLEDGDELLLATDGVFDQLEGDWSGTLADDVPLFDAVRRLVEDAIAGAPQRDDLTMVFVRRQPSPTPAEYR